MTRAPPGVDAAADRIAHRVGEWQTRLLQLNRRNNLIYFKPGRSAVGISGITADDLDARLRRSRRGLEFPYAPPRAASRPGFTDRAGPDDQEEDDEPLVIPGDLETDCEIVDLQRRLGNLRRRDREWEEEQGINVLFLAAGFLDWVDSEGVRGRAPLVLIPCDLERKSPRDPFRFVREDDDPIVNRTLRHSLAQLGVELPAPGPTASRSGSPRTATAPTTPSTPTTSRAANASRTASSSWSQATSRRAASGPTAPFSGSATVARRNCSPTTSRPANASRSATSLSPSATAMRAASGTDGSTMWVLDGGKDSLFAYDLEGGELLAEYALDSANDDPHGIWSDRVTVWVSDHGAKRLFAYRLPALPDGEDASDEEDQELERVRDEEFGGSRGLTRASNNSPRGIWSDGDVMYVADASDGKVYTYNMPDAIDARLASLTLSGVDFGEFDSAQTEYAGTAGDDVTETTVGAEAAQSGATVVIKPDDADDGDPENGHQVALEEVSEITVTVTSADGSRERVYRVLVGDPAQEAPDAPAPPCFRGAVALGFSLVVYAGGSVEELVTCAQSRRGTALYTLHDGDYVPYILGAPDFVNSSFGELFADGVPATTPLIVKSDGPPTPAPAGSITGDDLTPPWPECLRGTVATGFSLVLYRGGAIEELVTCAESRDITAIYALDEGGYVAYILGAPEFVNRSFGALFAGGVPAAAPLIVKSDGVSAAGATAGAP